MQQLAKMKHFQFSRLKHFLWIARTVFQKDRFSIDASKIEKY